MSVSSQFNDYVAWCTKTDPKPQQVGDIGLFQTRFGLSGHLSWFVDGKLTSGSNGGTVFIDVGKIEKFKTQSVPPFGSMEIPIITSLAGSGYHQKGPATLSQGIPFDFFNMEVLRPSLTDTTFTFKVSGFELAGGDSVDSSFHVGTQANNPDSMVGITKTKMGKVITFFIELAKGSQKLLV